MDSSRAKSNSGFTLMELLVVMAILGVLATIAIVAVNPIEQLARSRDTSRISAITQLGSALSSYRVSHNDYPVAGTSWIDSLRTSRDLAGNPENPNYVNGLSCNEESTLGQGGYCYNTSSTETIIYAQLEASLYNKNCQTAPNTQAYWVFSIQNGRSCGVCGEVSSDPPVTSAITCDF